MVSEIKSRIIRESPIFRVSVLLQSCPRPQISSGTSRFVLVLEDGTKTFTVVGVGLNSRPEQESTRSEVSVEVRTLGRRKPKMTRESSTGLNL